MSELTVKEGIIIDDVENVVKLIQDRTGFRNVDINDVVDFINHEPGTIFYVDEKFNVKLEKENTRYLWLDTGFEENDRPIFISLLAEYGEYVGHYTGEYRFLTTAITNYYPQNYKAVNDNIRKFEQKYDRQVEGRMVKHLTEKYLLLEGEDADTFSGYTEESEQETKKLVQEPREMSVNTYGNQEYYSACELGAVIRKQLLVDKWRTAGGFERFLKIIGARVWQLVQQGRDEFFVINKTKSLVVNTGLLDKFGMDIKVMYRINLTTNTYNPYRLILSKQDFLDNEFTKEQANAMIRPISFLDDGEDFNVRMEDFDISTRALIHIIEERRSRFPQNLQDMSCDKLAQKIEDALRLGLKMQERDRSYVKPSYSGKTGKISWAMPLHANNEFTEEPELVLVIVKQNVFYEVKTVLPYDDAVKDRLNALALYEKLW